MFNETAKAVASAGDLAKYDAQAKNVLADKNILARILQQLEETYGIPMKDKLEKEVKLMCNLSGYYLETGIEQGIEKGIEQTLAIYRLLTENPEWDNERLSEETGYSPDEVRKVREKIELINKDK